MLSCVDCLGIHGLYSLPGSSGHGILQARMLEWVAMPYSRGIFPTQRSNPCLLHWQARFFITSTTWKAHLKANKSLISFLVYFCSCVFRINWTSYQLLQESLAFSPNMYKTLYRCLSCWLCVPGWVLLQDRNNTYAKTMIVNQGLFCPQRAVAMSKNIYDCHNL